DFADCVLSVRGRCCSVCGALCGRRIASNLARSADLHPNSKHHIMSKSWNVAVVGATGLVGGTMLSILEQRNFPVKEIFPLASARSVGKTVKFKGRDVPVQDLETFDFTKAQIGLFSAGASVSKIHAVRAGQAGCIVVDNTSQFRYQDDIPLVVS